MLLGLILFLFMVNDLNSTSVRSRDATFNMIRILAKQRRGIHICHINAQSLNNKTDEFRVTFENSSVDVICVSETWLVKGTPDSLVNLNGYRIFRADRDTRAGGVAIYVKDSIKCNFKCKFSTGEKVEYLFVEVISEGAKMLIGCVYRPDKYIDMTLFMDELERLTTSYTDLIIAGDFNCNVLMDSYVTDNMISIGLAAINRAIPTHFTSRGSTLLDLFFVNNMSKVILYDQLSAPCFSKHDLIFTTYNFDLIHEVQTIAYRDFKNINYQVLEENLYQISWNALYYMPSVDEQLDFLENNIYHLYNLTVNVRTKINKSNTRPWFTTSIKLLIDRRDRAYTRWKKFKIPELKEEYRSLRRDVTREIRKSKSVHYSNRFKNAINTKQTWKTIRDIGIGHSTKKSSCNLSPDELNEAFQNLPIVENPSPVQYINNNEIPITFQQFNFRCITNAETLFSLLSIKSNAIGYDDIHPKFIKILLPYLLPYISHLFNTILTTSIFPKRWKHAKIIPVPKTTSEFRPIAILPYMSKALERIMHDQINTYLRRFKLLNEKQSGFRQKHSCITALIDVTEDIRDAIDGRNVSFLVLLDHSKAFDTVNHNILCSKLSQNFNFSSTSEKLIKSYLETRFQSVYINNQCSTPRQVPKGVPQGSILGPLLFSMYVNDLPQHVYNCKVHLYADDIQIYLNSSIKYLCENVTKLNDDLNRIYLWASANGLCLNPLKSKCLIIHKKSLRTNLNFDILLNNQKIEIVSSSKNLGVVINNTLSWNNHVNSAVGKTYGMLRTLWATQSCTPLNIRVTLAKSYLIPVLLYGCEIFANCDSNSTRKLHVAYNSIIRYVFGLRKRDRVSPYSKRLLGNSFENILKAKVLILLHKIIYLKEPAYLFNRLNFARSHRGKKLIPILHRSLISEWQFFFYAIRLWNLLPNRIQTNNNAIQFKKQISEHFS